MVSAISISAALLGTSTAFAVANGIFGARAADHVGSFQPITERLTPATRPKTAPATSAGRPPAVAEPEPGESHAAPSRSTTAAVSAPDMSVPVVTPAPSAPPVAHSTASPASTPTEKELDDSAVANAAERDD